MNDGEFPIWRRLYDRKGQRDEPRIERAPVRIDGRLPVFAKVSFGNVQVRHRVSIHQVMMVGPRMDEAQKDRESQNAISSRLRVRPLS